MITLELDEEHAKEIVQEIEKQCLRKPMREFLKQLQEKLNNE